MPSLADCLKKLKSLQNMEFDPSDLARMSNGSEIQTMLDESKSEIEDIRSQLAESFNVQAKTSSDGSQIELDQDVDERFEQAQIKKENGQASMIGDLDYVKDEYPDHHAAIEETLSRLGEGEAGRIRQNLETHKGTLWAMATTRAMVAREILYRALEGKSIDDIADGTFWSAGGKVDWRNTKVVKAFMKGEDFAKNFAQSYNFFGANRKAEQDFSGSFLNCDPSKDCAKYCYSAGGTGGAPAGIMKSELTEWVANHHPDILVDNLSRGYSAMPAGMNGLTLRMNEKGDLSEAQLKVIKELNKNGIRVQVFSKRPDLLREVDSFNWRALSVDATNVDVALDNPDLPLAVIATEGLEEAFVAEVKDRINVILPVNMKGKEWEDGELQEMFPSVYNEVKKRICPVDGGKRTTKPGTTFASAIEGIKTKSGDGAWTCTACDELGSAGCFWGENKAEAARKVKEFTERSSKPLAEQVDEQKEKVQDAIRKLAETGGIGADQLAGLLAAVDGAVRDSRSESEQEEAGRGNQERGAGGVAKEGSGGVSGPEVETLEQSNPMVQSNHQEILSRINSQEFDVDYSRKGSEKGGAKRKAFIDEVSTSDMTVQEGVIGDPEADIWVTRVHFDENALGGAGSWVVEGVVRGEETRLTGASWAEGLVNPHFVAAKSLSVEVGAVDAGSQGMGMDFLNALASIPNEERISYRLPTDILHQDKARDTTSSPRGQVEFTSQETIIRIFEGSDRSTFMHEIGHVFLRDMKQIYESGMGDEQFKQDYLTLDDWMQDVEVESLGSGNWQIVEGGKKTITVKASSRSAAIARGQQEKLARGFEAYLREGKAPSEKLAGSFRKFKSWLMAVYASISKLQVKLNDDVRGVFDRMLATDQEIKMAESYYEAVDGYVGMYESDQASKDSVGAKRERAQEDSREKRLAKLMKEWQRLEGGRAGMRTEAEKEIDDEEMYSMLSDIVEIGGMDYAALAAEVGEELAQKILTTHGKGMAPHRTIDLGRIKLTDMRNINAFEGHEEALSSNSMDQVQSQLKRIARGLDDLRKRIERKVTRSKATSAKYDAAEEIYDSTNDGVAVSIRLGTGAKITDSGTRISQEQYNKLIDGAWVTLSDIGRMDLDERLPELVDMALSLGTKANARKVRKDNIQGIVAQEVRDDINAGIYTLERMQAEAELALEAIEEGFDFDVADIESSREKLIPVSESDISPDEIAGTYGYDSVQAMAEAMADAPSRTKAITAKTDENIAKQEELFREEMAKEEAHTGDEDYHTDVRLDYLIAEYNSLVRAQGQKTKSRVEKLRKQVIIDSAAEIISSLKGRDAASYTKFSRAEAKYARQAREALKKGDLDAAEQLIYRQVLNHALVIESVKVRQMMEKAERKFAAKNVKSKIKNMEWTYREALLDLVQTYGFVQSDSLKPQESGDTLNLPSARTEESDPELYNMLPDPIRFIPDWIIGKVVPEGYTNYKDLTVSEIVELTTTMGMIMSVGNEDLKALKSDKAATIGDLRQMIMNNMMELTDKKVEDDRIARKKHDRMDNPETYKRLGAGLKMVEFLAEEMDNFRYTKSSEFGPMRKIFNRGVEAEQVYENRTREMYAALQPHFEVLSEFRKRMKEEHGGELFPLKDIRMPDQLAERRGRKKWDADMLISIVLNMGNEEGIQRLEDGYGFGPEYFQAIAQLFTSEELMAIQGIIDNINSLWPEVSNVHFSLTNKRPVKVESAPFSVDAADGVVVNMAGGYYPLSYDRTLSNKHAAHKEMEIMKDRQNAVFQRSAKPKSGSMITRKENVKDAILLDVSQVLIPHVQDTVRIISHAQYLSELDQLTADNEFAELFQQKFGNEMFASFRKWINFQARPERRLTSGWEKILDKQRQLNTLSALGLRFKTGIKQRLSNFNGWNEMCKFKGGMKYIVQGLVSAGMPTLAYGSKKSEMVQTVNNKSDYMNNRSDAGNRDVRDMTRSIKPFEDKIEILGKKFTWKDVKNFMMSWVLMNDTATVYPMWQGAYLQAKGEGLNGIRENMDPAEAERRAVEYADGIIRISQPSTLPVDLSEVQRSGEAIRFFTGFMTFVLKAGNRLVHNVKARKEGAISNKDLIQHLIVEWAFPAYTMLMLATMFYDDDDEPKWYDWLVAVPETIAGSAPILREASAFFRYGIELGQVPAFRGANIGMKALKDLATEDKTGKGLLGVAKFIEYQSGVPVSNLYNDYVKEKKKITGKKK